MTTQPPQAKAIPEMSPEAWRIVDLLTKASQNGGFVGYSALNSAIGGDVQGKQRGYLATARRHMLRHHSQVWECVMGKGVKLLDAPGILTVGSSTIERIRRTTRKGMAKLRCADTASLSRDQQHEYNYNVSMLGALHLATKSSNQKLIEEGVKKRGEQMPGPELLAMFKQ